MLNLRTVTLTATKIATQYVTTDVLQKKIREAYPEMFETSETLDLSKEELVKLAKIIGVSIGVTLVAGLIATTVTDLVDQVVFPNETGEF